MRELELLSVVALLEDIMDHTLLRGQVGTVVERLALACTKSSSATTRDGLTPPGHFVPISCCSFITSRAIGPLDEIDPHGSGGRIVNDLPNNLSDEAGW